MRPSDKARHRLTSGDSFEEGGRATTKPVSEVEKYFFFFFKSLQKEPTAKLKIRGHDELPQHVLPQSAC